MNFILFIPALYQGKVLKLLTVETVPYVTYFLKVRDKKGEILAGEKVVLK